MKRIAPVTKRVSIVLRTGKIILLTGVTSSSIEEFFSAFHGRGFNVRLVTGEIEVLRFATEGGPK